MATDVKRRALELFLAAAGPALVREVAEILGARGIPVMPLKGVLLQQLVYGPQRFRPISDVDILVPEARFYEAHAALREAGFTGERWEPGDWQVAMKRPGGLSLDVDLHRLLSRTPRSRLTGDGVFERGMPDKRLFGVEVVLPSADDLFAHLLMHATLHWVRYGRLHRPEDFQAVAESRSMASAQCAKHLRQQGLVRHALLFLPLIVDETGSSFASKLIDELASNRRDRTVARWVRALCARFEPGHPARRLAGLALAPALSGTVASVVRDRLRGSRPV